MKTLTTAVQPDTKYGCTITVAAHIAFYVSGLFLTTLLDLEGIFGSNIPQNMLAALAQYSGMSLLVFVDLMVWSIGRGEKPFGRGLHLRLILPCPRARSAAQRNACSNTRTHATHTTVRARVHACTRAHAQTCPCSLTRIPRVRMHP